MSKIFKKSFRLSTIILSTVLITTVVIFFCFYLKLKNICNQDNDNVNAFLTRKSIVPEVNTNSKEYLFAKADDYNLQKNFENGVVACTKYLELEPDNIKALSARAYAYCGLKKYDLALKDFNRIVAIDPENTDALSSIASVYKLLNQQEKFKETFDKLLKVQKVQNDKAAKDPENIQFYLTRAESYDKKHEFEKSEEYYQKGQEIIDKKVTEHPDNLYFLADRVSFYSWYVSRNPFNNIKIPSYYYDTIISDCTKIMKRNPEDAVMYLWRGDAFLRKGEYQRAIDDYSQCIKLKPDDELKDGYYFRSAAYFYNDDYENAMKDMETYFKIKSEKLPDPLKIVGNWIRIYKLRGNLDKVIEGYTRMIKYNPGIPDLYKYRAHYYGLTGQDDNEIADYSKIIELEPHNAIAYKNRCEGYLNKGELDKALADCNQAIKLDPSSKMGYYCRGCVFIKLNKLDEATSDLFMAMALSNKQNKGDPRGWAKPYLKVNEISMIKKDYKAAISFCDKAIVIEPDNHEVYYYKGKACEAAVKMPEAREAYKKCVEFSVGRPIFGEERKMLDYAKEKIKTLEKP